MKAQTMFVLLAGILLSGGWAWSSTPLGPDVPSMLASREPAWTLERQESSNGSVTYYFDQEGQRLVVSVYLEETADLAAARVASLRLRVTADPVEIAGIGDRCLVWTDPKSGATTIVLCRENVTIHLVAGSRDEAIEIATYLDEQLTLAID